MTGSHKREKLWLQLATVGKQNCISEKPRQYWAGYSCYSGYSKNIRLFTREIYIV